MSEAWTVVKPKKKSRNKGFNSKDFPNKAPKTILQVGRDKVEEDDPQRLSEAANRITNKLLKLGDVLSKSHVYSKSVDVLESLVSTAQFSQAVFLGIGSFSTSSSALLQLAFGLTLCRCFNVPLIEIWDPQMSSLDLTLCDRLLLTPNREAPGRSISGPTLYFMPHCPYMLYNQVMWSNWNELSNVIILGNR
jgi:hypothetical protein